ELPGPRGRQYAAALGLRALVVHGDELSREEQSRWAAAEQAGHLRRLTAFGPDVVYGIDAVPLASSLRVSLVAPEVLATGVDATIGLRLAGAGTRPWAQREPHRVARGAVRWPEGAGGKLPAAR